IELNALSGSSYRRWTIEGQKRGRRTGGFRKSGVQFSARWRNYNNYGRRMRATTIRHGLM
ncbi:hypothetical protein FOZ63_001053, partial [Perkinsus olseni]